LVRASEARGVTHRHTQCETGNDFGEEAVGAAVQRTLDF